MPSFSDLPATAADIFDIEDINKYYKLPYYYVPLEAKRAATWPVYNQLFGKTPWKPNMGPIMRGVRAEPTPKIRQDFYPNPIQIAAKRDVFETLEFMEDSVVKWHYFDSKLFNFIPPFQDFRRNQLDFNHKDINEQILYSNDIFVSSVLLQKSRYAYICGNKAAGGNLISGVPFIPAGTDITADTVAAGGKSTNWLIDVATNKIGANLRLRYMSELSMVMRDDLGLPFFEGTVNTPKDNELVKGRYVFIGSSEAYQMFPWDEDFQKFRNVNFSIVNNGFNGSLFDLITYRPVRYPLRFKNDGTFPAPEIVTNFNETVPNPEYVNAPNEIGFLVSADVASTIDVGPPPREFAVKEMAKDKFYSLRWNGEIQLTDQVLIKDGDGNLSLNSRGQYLKLQATMTYGCIMRQPRGVVPVFFKRARLAK